MEVPVAEPAAAIRVQTATVRELRAAVLAVAWVVAPVVDLVVVLLRVVAPEAGRAVVQAFLVDREVVSGEPGMAPAADLALVQVVAPAGPAVALVAGWAVAQDFPGDREVIPVVRVSALPAAPREVRQEDRAEEVVQRAPAVALPEVQAVAQATVEVGAALVAGRAVVVQGVAQATAVPGPAIMANAV